MIDRQKQNLRKSDIHGEEASELKSTPQIHAPHPETSHATEVDTEEEGAGIDIAARWLLDAQAILVFCGATVSVPVGQTRRHGIHKQLEPLVEQYGVSLEQALSEDWFQQDPYLAWGFLLRAMRSLEKYTHQGFSAVRGWFDLVPCGGIVVTEEQDGSWHRSGLTHPGLLVRAQHTAVVEMYSKLRGKLACRIREELVFGRTPRRSQSRRQASPLWEMRRAGLDYCQLDTRFRTMETRYVQALPRLGTSS